jgi:acylphosphatase
MIRQTVFYTGRVQGVGFRFTTSHIARGFQVTGSVRNLADGRVELIAEGDRQEVKKFLAALAENMAANIKNIESHEGAATGEFSGFNIGK